MVKDVKFKKLNYLKRGYKKLTKSVNEHKKMVFFLIFLQIMIFSLLGYSTIKYVPEIIEHARNIIEPLEANGLANLDPTGLETTNSTASAETVLDGLFSFYKSNRISIKDNYTQMMNKVRNYLLILAGVLIFIGGLSRVLIKRIFTRKERKRKMFNSWVKYASTWLIFMIPLFFLSYLFLKTVFKISLLGNLSGLLNSFSWYFILIVYLFSYLIFTTATVFIDTRSWKSYISKVHDIGIRKLQKIFLVFLINITIISLGFYLVYLSQMTENLFLMILTALIFVSKFVISKIFWTACILELANENDGEIRKKRQILKKVIKIVRKKVKK